ncbi:hypothetical protein JXA47_10425 [Candidatus Sumerlaeota bacterium]|nr:hypothetical protein [Candidatus Sumerlaeota bacterium]
MSTPKATALLLITLFAMGVSAQYPQMPPTPTLQPLVIQPVSLSQGTAIDFPSVRADFGVMSCEIPQGWTASLHLGDTSMGGFFIRVNDPNLRFEIRVAHNWVMLNDQQVGGYFPGNQIFERYLLPAYAQEIQPYQVEGVLARSQNRRTNFAPPDAAAMGIQMPLDSGTLSFAVRHPHGERLIGQSYTETLRIYEMPDMTTGITWGMYTVRICTITVAPATEAAQRLAQRALEQMAGTLVLSGAYQQAWAQGFAANQAIVSDYSSSMDQIISQGWADRSRSQDEMAEQWAIYMRGGQWGQDPTTGETHWITNDHTSWFVDGHGNVVGSDSGAAPNDGRSWRPLSPIGL